MRYSEVADQSTKPNGYVRRYRHATARSSSGRKPQENFGSGLVCESCRVDAYAELSGDIVNPMTHVLAVGLNERPVCHDPVSESKETGLQDASR
jgi:hypothetical protein